MVSARVCKDHGAALPPPQRLPEPDTVITYGVENRIGQVPTAKRAYFIIDKQGIIRFKGVMHTINPKAPLFPNQVLLDGLKKINNGE